MKQIPEHLTRRFKKEQMKKITFPTIHINRHRPFERVVKLEPIITVVTPGFPLPVLARSKKYDGKKIAILLSGTAYNYKFSIDSMLKNMVIPNDADVFILTSRENDLRRTTDQTRINEIDPDEWHKKSLTIKRDKTSVDDDQVNVISKTFGDRLKGFQFIEDIPGYSLYLESEQRRLAGIINNYSDESRSLKIKPAFRKKVASENNTYLMCMINQYNNVKMGFEIMKLYENKNNCEYDFIARVRMDFIVPEKIYFSWYYLNQDLGFLNVMGSVRENKFEWCDEYCFFARKDTANTLFSNLNQIGFITNRKYNTINPDNKEDYCFSPEVQFSLLCHELNLSLQQVKIFRSATYTDGGDGYDYFNYKFSIGAIFINYEYHLVCRGPSDINEHLPILKQYAEKCDHVTELGTRFGNSAIAFLAAKTKKFITYDVAHNDRIDYLKKIAKWNDINFEIKIENPTSIEKTDLLFIDTNHHVEQCSLELKLHADNVNKYIIFHDTTTFWEKGQGHEQGGGLKYAIEPFLENHKEWKEIYRAHNNNGLLILERK